MRALLAILFAVSLLAAMGSRAGAAADTVAQPPAAQPQTSLTFAAAQADFDKGDYRGCLGKISKLLTTGAYKSDSPERYDLLMLRGESLLRLKQRQGAQAAFEAATKMMRKQEDVQRAAAATALVVMVKASTPALTYQQKKGGDAVDIIEPISRQKAMGRLMEDLRAKVRPDFQKAINDDSLVPTHNLLRPAWELYSVEMAATGDTALTSEKLQELGAHARKLIAAELTALNRRLDQLEDLAGEPVGGDYGYGGGVRGLRTEERNELERSAKDLVQVEETIQNGRRIARLFGRSGENWDALLAECSVARDSAQRAYDRRY